MDKAGLLTHRPSSSRANRAVSPYDAAASKNGHKDLKRLGVLLPRVAIKINDERVVLRCLRTSRDVVHGLWDKSWRDLHCKRSSSRLPRAQLINNTRACAVQCGIKVKVT